MPILPSTVDLDPPGDTLPVNCVRQGLLMYADAAAKISMNRKTQANHSPAARETKPEARSGGIASATMRYTL